LREQARASQRPRNAKELFNLRHASLRNVIERTFGVLKGRFVILQKPPRQYNIGTQVRLVFALTAVHNFMNLHGCDPEDEAYDEDDESGDEEEDQYNNSHDAGMNSRRDNIAQQMWEDYQAYVNDFDEGNQ
jgi:DDE superfamily endonuclease